MSGAAAQLAALKRAISGDVVVPGSAAYEALRAPQIPNYADARPLAVVLCGSPADVAQTISLARRLGLRAAIRSGGHCFAGRSSTGEIVIDVSPMRDVAVTNGSATVGAGARLGDVYDALDQHGVTIAAGCGPTVGIAGLVLGGGLGILGRTHGLTCDQLLAAEVVLANARVVVCDAHRDGELFWALRGAGGGQFGVVTSLELATVTPPTTTCLHLTWPVARAAAVIEAWQAWSPPGPAELAASLLVTAGPDPDRPAVVHVFGAMLGTEPTAVEQLSALIDRIGHEPQAMRLHELPYRDAKRYLAEHGPGDQPLDGIPEQQRDDGHVYSKSEFFVRSLPAEAIVGLIKRLTSGRRAGQSRELDFSPWGGAYNRTPTDATAFAHRDALFLLKQAVTVDPSASPQDSAAGREWLAQSWASVHRWGTGGVYPNFPDPDLPDWERAYHGANYERLVAVKARYDPDDFFGFEQSIPARLEHAA